MEVPNDPIVIRVKFESPLAAGIWSGRNPDNVIVTSGMKKSATAAPWTIVGIMMVRRSACVLKCERITSTTAKIANEALASQRGSTRWILRPTSGDMRIARAPTGASAMPASVAV
jgi:hypothetical protein